MRGSWWANPWSVVVGKPRHREPRCDWGAGGVICLPGAGGHLVWGAASVRARQSPHSVPWQPPLCWLQAGGLQSAQLTSQLPLWGQRLGCRADHGQAPWAGPGLGEGAVIPASHSSYHPLPREGPRESEQAMAPSGGAGRTLEGLGVSQCVRKCM